MPEHEQDQHSDSEAHPNGENKNLIAFDVNPNINAVISQLGERFGMNQTDIWSSIIAHGIKTLCDTPGKESPDFVNGFPPALYLFPAGADLRSRIVGLLQRGGKDIDALMVEIIESGVLGLESEERYPETTLLEPHKFTDLDWSTHEVTISNEILNQQEN